MIKCTFDPSFEFNKVHGYEALKSLRPQMFYEDYGETIPGTTHWLFIDTPNLILRKKEEVLKAKSQGIEIISFVYDEARFPLVDELIKQNLIDKLILFDKQYTNRFKIPTYISDYYVSETQFPVFNNDKNGKMCYFGHLLYERTLPSNCKHIKAKTLSQLYQMASNHSMGYVSSTGVSELEETIYHNKAKFLEMLFCGLKVKCQEGINTLNYDIYKDVEITQEDLEQIKSINLMVRQKIIEKIIEKS